MRLQINRINAAKLVLFAAILALILLIIMYIKIIYIIIFPFLISFFIAYLFNPIVCRMESRGLKRGICVIVIYIILLLSVGVICSFIIPELIRDAGRLVDVLPQYTSRFMSGLTGIQDRFARSGFPSYVRNIVDNNVSRIEYSLIQYLEGIATVRVPPLSRTLNYVLVPFILYYFLKDYKKIIDRIKLIIPRKYRRNTLRICSNIDDIFGNYIRSQLILSLLVGIMTGIALYLLRINFALILGILNGITNIIPYFGPIIGMIPAVVIALLDSPVKAAWTAAVLFIIQQIESGIICPVITGDSVDLHPVTVILALVAGSELFGTMGMILGVPVVAALKVIYNDIMKSLF